MYYFIIIILIYQVYDTVFRYKNRILDIKKSILVIKKSNSYYSESDVLLAIKKWVALLAFIHWISCIFSDTTNSYSNIINFNSYTFDLELVI